MQPWAPAVYFLCLFASALCAWLLARSYSKTGTKLLLWSSLCFVFLAINNLLVVVDLLFVPTIDLTLIRQFSSMAALVVLLYGFIWELD